MENMFELLGAHPSIQDRPGAKPLAAPEQGVFLENVDFQVRFRPPPPSSSPHVMLAAPEQGSFSGNFRFPGEIVAAGGWFCPGVLSPSILGLVVVSTVTRA
mgnify:CR=1 FL=1